MFLNNNPTIKDHEHMNEFIERRKNYLDLIEEHKKEVEKKNKEHAERPLAEEK